LAPDAAPAAVLAVASRLSPLLSSSSPSFCSSAAAGRAAAAAPPPPLEDTAPAASIHWLRLAALGALAQSSLPFASLKLRLFG